MLRSCSHAVRAAHTASPLRRCALSGARRHAGRIEELILSKKNRDESVSKRKGAKKTVSKASAEAVPASAELEGKQMCPPVIGHVENIYIDPEPITLRNSKGNIQLWRHLYTVAGTTAVKYISKEWMRDRIEPGIDIGRIVCMTCVSDSSGNLSLKGIRPASPKEVKAVTATEAVRYRIRSHSVPQPPFFNLICVASFPPGPTLRPLITHAGPTRKRKRPRRWSCGSVSC